MRVGFVVVLGFGFLGSSTGCTPPDSAGDDAQAVIENELKKNQTVVVEKELFVTDLSAVNSASYTHYTQDKWNTDPEGGLSFGRLIDNMNRVEKPSDLERSRFVMSWLRTWETPQQVNGQTLEARPLVRSVLLTPWKLASVGRNGNTSSSCTADPSTDFTCKLSFASDVVPFRLLAIAYRPDLRVLPRTGTPGAAGQGRFVFGVLDAARNPLQFTVILEYTIEANDANAIQQIAKEYQKLAGEPWGTKFNQKLHERTLAFTKWNGAPSRRNGSALLQLRTNELPLSPPGADPTSPRGQMWEMREFVLGASGDLTPQAVELEPRIALDNSTTLRDWALSNSASILSQTHGLPDSFAGIPFRAASSLVPFSFRWAIPGVPEDVRAAFALNTCNGCHRAETATSFLHVKNRAPGDAAVLSPFLTAQLALGGPRVLDYLEVTSKHFGQIDDGPGHDH